MIRAAQTKRTRGHHQRKHIAMDESAANKCESLGPQSAKTDISCILSMESPKAKRENLRPLPNSGREKSCLSCHEGIYKFESALDRYYKAELPCAES